MLRYTALLLYTQLCCKSTFLSKSKIANRECCMANLLFRSLNEEQLNKSNERSHLTTELLCIAHGDTPGKPESKLKGSQSLKGVDRLVQLLPFACAFKSSDLKT